MKKANTAKKLDTFKGVKDETVMSNNLELVTPETTVSKAKDLLNKLKKTEPKSKSGVPEIDDPSLYEAVNTIVKLQKEIEDIQAKADLLKEKLFGRAYTEYSAYKGAKSSCKFLDDKSNPAVMVTYKNQFTEISMDNEEVLQGILGQDYEKYFIPSYVIELKDKSIAGVEKLIELVGEDMFTALFDVKKQVIKPCETMNADQFTLRKDYPEVSAYVVQYKPSMKKI